ncbi:GntR family transcriptional regulator [Burkholderia plantarii]|uniref:GntR family transcriptional regulator n=1 Tax=Burkholderia plantarii TaxID=41899 RepID=UPI0006D8C714|nr:GntR family transcriptional regulator [Burkholderia plantarii]ALK33858.1 GntR family transcriptional regulator [Burkholderia plantarii]GLZ19544.1 GntR family transcriptional regulator [Burkholderia plantarii]
MGKPYRTIQEYVLGTLRAEILQGVYAAGTRLRQEEVARRLEVSTTPVREAFRDLRAEGLVAIDPNKGVEVRGLTAGDVSEIYELRMLLEPMLAARACGQASEAQLEAATACHDAMSEAAPSSEQWTLLNEEFHQALMQCEAGTRLFEVVRGLSLLARPYVSLSMYVQPDIMASNNHDHAQLLAAWRARDTAAVHEQTRLHLLNTRDAIVACVDRSAGALAA